MKPFLLLFLSSWFILPLWSRPLDKGPSKKRYKVPRYSSKTIRDRVNILQKEIDLVYNSSVRRYIHSYVLRGRKGSELILGRSAIYFPIFDEYIEKYQMPPALRCLAIVESALEPKAKSPVGAAGLWQFMPKTARLYGLKINNYVDERYDTHKATDAAIRYLADLYQMYQNWTLAIAAYNCGPGRLDKAIRKARSRRFHKIKRHLPKETQQYVLKFAAVNYLMNYYFFHDLRPEYPDYTLQMTHTTRVYKRTSLKSVAQETGIPFEVILQLNPTYKKKIIPPSAQGYLLVLPRLGLSQVPDIGIPFEDRL
ncbi:MAG: lytic transglycosylase domain-containing protein [Bacteroidota bacterium]